MSRRACIPINLFVLREVLGLPPHLTIEGVVQTDRDREDGTMRVLVTGKLCPEVDEGRPYPELSVVYQSVETGKAHVLSIHGLDT